MSKLTGKLTVQELYSSSATAGHDVGFKVEDTQGNRYRYVLNGAVALVEGNLIQSSARDVQFTEMAVPAVVAIGAKTLVITNGTTTTTANQFVGGTLTVTTSTGIGQVFTIVGNDVAVSGAALTFTIAEPVRVALATTSKVTAHMNDHAKVIVSPTTRTGKTVGVAIFRIAAGEYGFVQSGGSASVLSDVTVAALGEGISPSTTTAGAVTKQVTLLENIGTASILGVSAKVSPVWLMID